MKNITSSEKNQLPVSTEKKKNITVQNGANKAEILSDMTKGRIKNDGPLYATLKTFIDRIRQIIS